MSPIWTHCLENAPKRVNHASAAVDDMVYSFGGYCTGEDYSTWIPIIVHCLDTNSLEWHQVNYTCSSLVTDSSVSSLDSDVPFNRYGHTVVSYGSLVYLWGGRNDHHSCNTLFAFNPYMKEWSRPLVSGMIPASRDGHSACIAKDCIYIFGGFEEDHDRYSQDVHQLDLYTMTWRRIMTTGIPPSWRDFHTLSFVEDKLYVFGGRSDRTGPFHTGPRNEIYDNTMYSLDLSTSVWSTEPVESPPVGRRSHSAVVYNGFIYIFGGFNSVENSHYNALYVFDSRQRKQQIVMTKGKAPSPRRRQSCCLIGSKLFLFGGTRYSFS